MSGRGWRRRSVLGLGLLGPSFPLLAACAPSRTDPEPPSPQPADPPPDCVDLAEHRFQRGRTYCSEPAADDQGDGDMAWLDFQGPLVATGDTLTAWYVDAVAQWSIADGELTRLLAPKRADGWVFASRGKFTVVPRCDGALVVHTDGCRATELDGHAPSDAPPLDGVQGVVLVDDTRLASLGADHMLRLWDVASAAERSSRQLPEEPGVRHLGLEPAGQLLTVSGTTWLSTFDANTLEPRDQHTGLPEATSGWALSPSGELAGITVDTSGLTIHDPATGASQTIETNDPPKALAVSPSGVVAAVQGIYLHVRTPDGQATRTRLQGSSYHTGAIAFSPDEQTLHVLDRLEGIQSVRIADGTQSMRYTQPSV